MEHTINHSGMAVVPDQPGEAAQRASEQRYHAFVENSMEGIWRIEVDPPIATARPEDEQVDYLYRYGYLAECNDAYARMYGFSRADEIVGMRLSDVLVQSDPNNREYLRTFIRSGYRLTGGESVEIDRAGRTKYFLNNLIGIVENGILVRAWGTRRDITAQKRAETVRAATYRISETAHTAHNLDDLYRSIHTLIGELMPARNFYIALYDTGADILSSPYFVDQFDTSFEPTKPDKGLTAYVLRTGEPLLASPEVFDALVAAGEVELIGAPSIDWLGVPLKARGKTIGVLVLQTYTEGVRYGEEERDILEFVSTQVATAIERKQTEQALRESEERYRVLFESNPHPMWVYDLETFAFLAVNDAAVRHYGYSREEFLSITIKDIRPPEDVPALIEHVSKVIEGLNEAGMWRHRKKDGSIIDVEITSHRLVFSGRPAKAVLVNDITDRKRAERAVRESEENYRRLVELSPDAIGVHCEGRVVYVNPAAVRIFGAARLEDLIGRPILDFVHPDYRATVLERVRSSYQEGKSADLIEEKMIRLDGQIIDVEAVTTPVTYQGKPATQIIIRDITDRKRAEEALRQAQKLESLGVLAGGIAHDFNNLLVAMLGQTSLALAKLPPDHAARAHIEKAVTAAERAADLTRQMLAYSGHGPFQLQPLNLNRLIRDNLRLLESAVPKNVVLRSELAEPLPFVEGDIGQMQQVIMNLIINATEAIAERSGMVTVTTGTRFLSAASDDWSKYTGEALPPGCYASLEVRDEGSGIDAESLSKIFDPFFTTKFTGRGLGLAAVLGIVRGHTGGLRVESEVGRGTLFSLLFPATGEAPDQPEVPNTQEGSMPHRLILVIDDEAPVRDAITDILELEDMRVITAANGAEGIALYRERMTDIGLVLLDLSMPVLNGEETFHELRKIDPNARVVLLSGYTQVEAMRRFAGQGPTGFIHKPFNVATLIEQVRQYLE